MHLKNLFDLCGERIKEPIAGRKARQETDTAPGRRWGPELELEPRRQKDGG